MKRDAREVLSSHIKQLWFLRLTCSCKECASAKQYLSALEGPEVRQLVEAAKMVRQYLEERGIRTRGIVGRTEILPALDLALAAFQEPEQNK